MLKLNMQIKRNSILLLVLFFTYNSIAQSNFKKLVWQDEFNYQGLPDSTKWGYDKGKGCPENCGWGNNELQYYTWNRLENSRVENGKLILEVRKENFSGASYTSTRLATKNKGDWQYGKIEVKAKLPKGRGTWPAIWMLGSNTPLKWPDDGELDIMEHVGFNQVISTHPFIPKNLTTLLVHKKQIP